MLNKKTSLQEPFRKLHATTTTMDTSLNILIIDETTVSCSIHDRKRNVQATFDSSVLKPTLISPDINSSYGDAHSLSQVQNAPNSNLIVINIDGKELLEGTTEPSDDLVQSITCLSDSWQASRYTTNRWKFIDENKESKGRETTHNVLNVTLNGNSSELVVENDTVNDLSLRNDTTGLVGLFTERNKQLYDTIMLNK